MENIFENLNRINTLIDRVESKSFLMEAGPGTGLADLAAKLAGRAAQVIDNALLPELKAAGIVLGKKAVTNYGELGRFLGKVTNLLDDQVAVLSRLGDKELSKGLLNYFVTTRLGGMMLRDLANPTEKAAARQALTDMGFAKDFISMMERQAARTPKPAGAAGQAAGKVTFKSITDASAALVKRGFNQAGNLLDWVMKNPKKAFLGIPVLLNLAQSLYNGAVNEDGFFSGYLNTLEMNALTILNTMPLSGKWKTMVETSLKNTKQNVYAGDYVDELKSWLNDQNFLFLTSDDVSIVMDKSYKEANKSKFIVTYPSGGRWEKEAIIWDRIAKKYMWGNGTIITGEDPISQKIKAATASGNTTQPAQQQQVQETTAAQIVAMDQFKCLQGYLQGTSPNLTIEINGKKYAVTYDNGILKYKTSGKEIKCGE